MQYALQTDRLRPRQRNFFFGFTTGEIEKMEKLFLELGPEETTTKEFCSKLVGSFNRSSGRAGKPLLKWTEVQRWFMERQKEWNQKQRNGPVKEDVSPLSNGKADSSNVKEYSSNGKEDSEVPRGQKNQGLPNLEFEAKSSKDAAWYDVDLFLAHRFINGEAEVLVRFSGFGPDEDEWVNIKESIRERSIPLENSECNRLKVGDFVLCFREKRDQAIYYDAHIKEIQRKVHDIRGCRCLFLIRYDHDNSEEKVKLRRLCRRPTW